MNVEPAPERAAYSVNSFCKAHDFSRALFYRSLKEGWGPTVMKVASRTIISVEAAADFRRRMEARAAGIDDAVDPVTNQSATA